MATNPDAPKAVLSRFDLARAAVVDLVTLAGAGLLAYGCWLAYHPAGFIVGGLVLIAAGLSGWRR